MLVPLDTRLKVLHQVPHTISYVIRKRQQVDSLSELPKEKQPTNEILWDGSPEDLDDWLATVFDRGHKTTITDINLSEVEE